MANCEVTPEIKAIIKEMAKNRLDAGFTDAHDLVDAIHDAIKEHTPLWKSEIAQIAKESLPRVNKFTKEEAKTQLAALKKELDDMRNPPPATRPVDPNVAKNRTRQTQLNKQIAELTRQIGEKKFAKPDKAELERRKPKYDQETKAVEAKRDDLRKQADALLDNIKSKNRNWFMRGVDTFLALRRAMILSSVRTLGKLSLAAAGRMVLTPTEELIGSIIKHTPGLSGIAAKAPREGRGFSLGAEVNAKKGVFSKETLEEMQRKALSNYSKWDVKYGDANQYNFNSGISKVIDTGLNLPGRLHGVLKYPAFADEFYRSVSHRAAFERLQAIKKGMNPDEVEAHMNNPATQMSIEAKAYNDGMRAIFMNNNEAVSMYHRMLTMMERAGKDGSTTRALGVAFTKILQYRLPIVKIPTNYVGEVTSYTAGSLKAIGQILASRLSKVEMTGDQADYVFRNLKKQGVGALMMYASWKTIQNTDITGYYQEGDNKRGIKEKTIKIFGHEIPQWAAHLPALEPLFMAATIKRSMREHPGQWARAGVTVGKGLIDEIPFFDSFSSADNLLTHPEKIPPALGTAARTELIPPDVQRIVANRHVDANGDPIPMYPKTFVGAWKYRNPFFDQSEVK